MATRFASQPRERTVRASVAVLVASLLAGCATAPPYVVPTVPEPTAFKEAGPWVLADTTAPQDAAWWRSFGDTVLDGLMSRVEVGNPTLAAAIARFDQAGAELGRARSSLFPQLDAGANVSRERVPSRTLGPTTDTNASLGASLAYEVDLFGRVRNSIQAARAGAAASDADVRAIRLALQARLATAYFELRMLDARTVLLRETIAAFERAYKLTDTRHEGGIASGVDVSRALTVLANARAEGDAVIAARARAEHAIAILVGAAPADLSIAVVDRQLGPPTIPVTVPSVLLQQRPDVVAAERRVAAANARIGVARAALFPSITLGGSAGFERTSGNILSASNLFWALGPLSLVTSIFDGGARRADVRQARAQFDEAAASYRETVLTAFREVEDDLVTARQLAAQERNQAEATRAAQRTRDLAMTRYRDGATDYLEVVTAQTSALDTERALLVTRGEQLRIATDLVRAMGGLSPAVPAG